MLKYTKSLRLVNPARIEDVLVHALDYEPPRLASQPS